MEECCLRFIFLAQHRDAAEWIAKVPIFSTKRKPIAVHSQLGLSQFEA